MTCYAIGMTNHKRRSLFSARAGILGGRYRANLRIYSLGEGDEAQTYFSVRLWQAAVQRQVRLARQACAAQ